MDNLPPEVLKRLRELEQLVAQLQEQLEQRDKENAELRAQLGRNSGNSHRPPSSDPPTSGAGKTRREKRKKKSTGRDPGGQPGHKGKTRQRLSADEIDSVESLRPDACRGCGASLAGANLDEGPERHQVYELPPIRPLVSEYVLNSCTCRGCGARTRAALPKGISWSAFGPRIHALVGALAGHYHLPRRQTQQLLNDFFGLKVSLGAISKMERRVDAAMTPIVDEIVEAMRTSDAPTGMDETGWRKAGERRWLWVAVTDKLAVFLVRDSRGAKVVTELVGEGAGGRCIVTDRWSAYHRVPFELRQFCWSHLLRDFQKMADAPESEAKVTGEQLVTLGTEMFRWWHSLRGGTLSRLAFVERVEELKLKVDALLRRGALSTHEKSAGTCRDLAKHQVSIWTFARREGVEPTNNHTERALRPAVIWRKICLGTHSDAGARFVERILSIGATAQRQGRNVFEFMEKAVLACFGAIPVPSLVVGQMGT